MCLLTYFRDFMGKNFLLHSVLEATKCSSPKRGTISLVDSTGYRFFKKMKGYEREVGMLGSAQATLSSAMLSPSREKELLV